VRLLLDTHAFLWWLGDDARLGPKARAAIASPENAVFVSAASAWEIAVKRAGGKLAAPGDIAAWIEQSSFDELAIEVEHAIAAAKRSRSSPATSRSSATTSRCWTRAPSDAESSPAAMSR
jgi:PIN domain nuclease of toxin-antitoxin system